jgi:hypothetical protein
MTSTAQELGKKDELISPALLPEWPICTATEPL